jgi:hypothetical protein
MTYTAALPCTCSESRNPQDDDCPVDHVAEQEAARESILNEPAMILTIIDKMPLHRYPEFEAAFRDALTRSLELNGCFTSLMEPYLLEAIETLAEARERRYLALQEP